jgi:hypothetical protein
VNRLLGKYAGQVANVLDPKKLGRVKALAEGAGFSTTPTPWAFPATGRFLGDFSVPDVGDNVWVEFENGDPNRPVYSPGFWGEPQGQAETPGRARGEAGTYPKGTDSATTAKGATVNEPSDPFAAVYPKNRVIETSGGHLVELDDTPGAERLHVWAKGGSFFEFHADGKVVMKSAGARYVIVNGDDVLHVLGKLDLIADTEVGLASPELKAKFAVKADIESPDVKVTATSKVDVDSPVIELGTGALLSLIDTRVLAAINGHVHLYTPPLHPGPAQIPTLGPQGTGFPLTAAAVATQNVKGS